MDITWMDLFYGLAFGVFYLLGMFSGYEKAKKKYRGY